MIEVDYTDDLALAANAPTQAGFPLHWMEQAAEGIDLFSNAN